MTVEPAQMQLSTFASSLSVSRPANFTGQPILFWLQIFDFIGKADLVQQLSKCIRAEAGAVMISLTFVRVREPTKTGRF